MRKVKMTPELSKQIGWDNPGVSWPKLEDVEPASDYQILKWYRFLPSAMTVDKIEIQKRICDIVLG